MTCRALLWCGWADPSRPFDFPASVRDLELAVRAARRLGVRDEDMHAFLCREDLLPHGMRISPHPATVESLQRVVASLARGATADDALLFIATNHGERRGLMTSAPVDEFAEEELGPRLLTPEFLGRLLDTVPGTQIVVLATCHAGIFLELGRTDRAMLASCAADQRYLVERDPPGSPFLVELFRAWCSAELPGHESRFSGDVVDLDTAFTQAEQQLIGGYPAEYRLLKPLRQGTARWPLRR